MCEFGIEKNTASEPLGKIKKKKKKNENKLADFFFSTFSITAPN